MGFSRKKLKKYGIPGGSMQKKGKFQVGHGKFDYKSRGQF